jgi:hypothetical protein
MFEISHSKQQRKRWNKGGMVSDILTLRKREVGLKTAAKLHNVPWSTLQGYVNSASLNPMKLWQLHWDTRLFYLEILRIVYSITAYTWKLDVLVCRLQIYDTYLFSVRNELPQPFPNNKATAGSKWPEGSFRRHPHLCMRSVTRLKSLPLRIYQICSIFSKKWTK